MEACNILSFSSFINHAQLPPSIAGIFSGGRWTAGRNPRVQGVGSVWEVANKKTGRGIFMVALRNWEKSQNSSHHCIKFCNGKGGNH